MATLVQVLVATGPLAASIVEKAVSLPKAAAAAAAGVSEGLTDGVENLVNLILGGALRTASSRFHRLSVSAAAVSDRHGCVCGSASRCYGGVCSAAESALISASRTATTGSSATLHLATHGLLEVIGPIVGEAVVLVDIRDLLPEQLFEVEQLGPLIGLFFASIYLFSVWPVLLCTDLLLTKAKLPVMNVGYWLATALTLMLLLGILFAAVYAKRLATWLAWVAQYIVNRTLRSILDKTVRIELLGKLLQPLGFNCPDLLGDVKASLLDLCHLDLHQGEQACSTEQPDPAAAEEGSSKNPPATPSSPLLRSDGESRRRAHQRGCCIS